MNPAAHALFEAFPFLGAFLVGALIPNKRAWYERAAIGLVLGLSVLVVQGLWPSTEATAGVERLPESEHLLDLLVFLPLLSALALLFLPRQSPGLLKKFTLLVLLADFVASLFLLKAPIDSAWHYQHVVEWIPTFGIRYHVAVDGVSTWLIILTTLTTPIAAYVSFGSIEKRIKDLCFAFLLLHGAMLGAFVSLDLFLFFVFWELMLVPMLLLIGVWGGVERIKAAYKFFLYTMVGSMMMLAAILYLVWMHKELAGYFTFDYLALSRVSLPRTATWLCFAAFTLAFLIKVPMFPFHTWLPDAHVQAPTGGSIVLAAVLLKLGTYGYIRYSMGLFGGAAWTAAANLAGVALVLGVIYGALVAWKQEDVKRLVAYSSVAHMGFIMLGLFSATRSGMEGAILQMLNHGVSTGALFLLVGVIYDRRHTREVREFGGLAKVMPIYAAIFVVVTMSSIGVPGTNGFVGEFMIIMGAFTSETLGGNAHLQAGVAALGVILAAVYMLTVVQRMFFGPLDNPRNKGLTDLNSRETMALAPLVALVFIIGFFPSLFLNRISDSVELTLNRFRDARGAYQDAAESTHAVLMPRRGGVFEEGYPENPGEAAPATPEKLAAEAAQAANPSKDEP